MFSNCGQEFTSFQYCKYRTEVHIIPSIARFANRSQMSKSVKEGHSSPCREFTQRTTISNLSWEQVSRPHIRRKCGASTASLETPSQYMLYPGREEEARELPGLERRGIRAGKVLGLGIWFDSISWSIIPLLRRTSILFPRSLLCSYEEV